MRQIECYTKEIESRLIKLVEICPDRHELFCCTLKEVKNEEHKRDRSMSASTSWKSHIRIPAKVQSSLLTSLYNQQINTNTNATTNVNRSLRYLLIHLFIILTLIHLFIGQSNAQTVQKSNNSNSTHSLNNQLTVRQRRFSFFGIDDEKAGNYCANGGTLFNGKCECKFPYTGVHCTDFECRKF